MHPQLCFRLEKAPNGNGCTSGFRLAGKSHTWCLLMAFHHKRGKQEEEAFLMDLSSGKLEGIVMVSHGLRNLGAPFRVF